MLKVITFPAGLEQIRSGAFGGTGLTQANFRGDAPSDVGESVFPSDGRCTVYYLSGSQGFTSPLWHGYPAVMVDHLIDSPASWLEALGFPADTDLQQDLNGDGVSLLLAYALKLDPRLNQGAALPVPVVEGGHFQLSFYAIAPGVSYKIEASSDLRRWSEYPTQVSMEDPQQRILRSALGGPVEERYFRLVVEEE